jgi:hypothetical protein
LTLAKPPVVLIQPQISLMRLRMAWLTAEPGWRVVRLSMAVLRV